MFKKCFISPDLTKEQQAFDKELRTEVKKLRDKGETDVKIKRGRVVKTLASGGEVVMYHPSSK